MMPSGRFGEHRPEPAEERYRATLESVTNRTRSKAKRRDQASGRSTSRRPTKRKGRGTLPRWVPLAGFSVVVIAVAVAVFLRSTGTAAVTTGADPSVVAAVTGVPAGTLDAIGAPDGVTVPSALPTGTPPLVEGGKPVVLYIGAEYCPFCAAERWPMVVALSRFGTFSNLGQTESAGSPEVYPNTPTFSFHGASYTSPYLVFQGVETETNQRTLTGYTSLDTPTPQQQQLFQTYDAPPYVSSAGAIPFVLIGNRYVFNGSQYLPSVLQGMSAASIASSLGDQTSPQAKAIDGSANLLTAGMCTLTKQQPTDVCSSPGVTAAASKLQR